MPVPVARTQLSHTSARRFPVKDFRVTQSGLHTKILGNNRSGPSQDTERGGFLIADRVLLRVEVAALREGLLGRGDPP